ncbi:MAG: diacylglycerol/lipid kinase family protein, partial [Cyclobacteriaceae bacterium]
MKISRILFIVNPITGKSRLKQIPKFTQRYLTGNFTYEIVQSKFAGHSKQLAREARLAEKYDIIVAVGGDGTVNEVGSQLINSNIKLGIIPNGSGNGLARELGIPLNPIKALCLLNGNSFTTIDAGKVNGHPYFCTAGIGFDAHIGKLFAQSKNRGF